MAGNETGNESAGENTNMRLPLTCSATRWAQLTRKSQVAVFQYNVYKWVKTENTAYRIRDRLTAYRITCYTRYETPWKCRV